MTATDTVGFVRVNGELEPNAIAGEIAANVHRRIDEFLVCSAEWLDDAGRPLDQLQRVHIAGSASRVFDGIEAEVLETIVGAADLIEVLYA